jgi:hypothetical protein
MHNARSKARPDDGRISIRQLRDCCVRSFVHQLPDESLARFINSRRPARKRFRRELLRLSFQTQPAIHRCVAHPELARGLFVCESVIHAHRYDAFT